MSLSQSRFEKNPPWSGSYSSLQSLVDFALNYHTSCCSHDSLVTHSLGIPKKKTYSDSHCPIVCCLLCAAALCWRTENNADKDRPEYCCCFSNSLVFFLSRCIFHHAQGEVYTDHFYTHYWVFSVRAVRVLDLHVLKHTYLHVMCFATSPVWCLGSTCRDFAYVARDNLTQVLKCHVFRCDSPAKNIATSLHEMCSKVRHSPIIASSPLMYQVWEFNIFFAGLQIMMERKSSRPGVSRLNSDPYRSGLIPVEGEPRFLSGLSYLQTVDQITSCCLPFFPEFPAPKNELFQHFHVYYLGCEAVAKPVGKNTASHSCEHTLTTFYLCVLIMRG